MKSLARIYFQAVFLVPSPKNFHLQGAIYFIHTKFNFNHELNLQYNNLGRMENQQGKQAGHRKRDKKPSPNYFSSARLLCLLWHGLRQKSRNCRTRSIPNQKCENNFRSTSKSGISGFLNLHHEILFYFQAVGMRHIHLCYFVSVIEHISEILYFLWEPLCDLLSGVYILQGAGWSFQVA